MAATPDVTPAAERARLWQQWQGRGVEADRLRTARVQTIAVLIGAALALGFVLQFGW